MRVPALTWIVLAAVVSGGIVAGTLRGYGGSDPRLTPIAAAAVGLMVLAVGSAAQKRHGSREVVGAIGRGIGMAVLIIGVALFVFALLLGQDPS